MTKDEALTALGGTRSAAAAAIGCTPQAISQWPDILPRRIEDRVLAALSRMKKPRKAKKDQAPAVA